MNTMQSRTCIAGVFVGSLAGAASGVMGLQASVVSGVLLGAVYGLSFAMLAGRHAVSPGAGLLWGLAYAFLLWLAVPAGIIPFLIGFAPTMGMLDTVRGHFHELVTYLLWFGIPLGIILGTLGGLE